MKQEAGRQSATPRLRSVLIWGLVWVAAGQAFLVVFLEWWHPEFLDPKYGCRLLALCARRSALQPRELWLVLGSSRAEQGFRPSLLTKTGAMEISPGLLIYNMARGGSSPLLYLLTLHRLLSDGVRPDALLVEIFPPALVEDEESTVIYKATLRDWPLLRRYPVSGRTWAYWLQDRLLLWYKYRSGFLAWAAPKVLLPQARWGEHLWDYLGGEWRAIGEFVSLQERRRLTDDARRRYAASLQRFHIAEGADRALRELLETCRTQGIAVALFFMPESSVFRSWYPPAALRQLADYLAALRREYGVPLIDARQWAADWDFSDGHHLLRRGAALFTHRFAKEARSILGRGRPEGRTSGFWTVKSSAPNRWIRPLRPNLRIAPALPIFSRRETRPNLLTAFIVRGMLGERENSHNKVRPITSRYCLT